VSRGGKRQKVSSLIYHELTPLKAEVAASAATNAPRLTASLM
jgi:hypothetical protein